MKRLVSNPQQQTPTAGEVETSLPYAYIGPSMRTESGILSEGDQTCIRHGVTEKYYFKINTPMPRLLVIEVHLEGIRNLAWD